MTGDCFILLVDDDVDIRDAVGEVLEEAGYRVTRVPNGKEALRVLRQEKVRPDLILLDTMMPEMDGWAFRAEQRKDPEIASIPIFAFTAYGSPEDTAQKMEAAGYLRKPLRLSELLSAISRLRGGSDEDPF